MNHQLLNLHNFQNKQNPFRMSRTRDTKADASPEELLPTPATTKKTRSRARSTYSRPVDPIMFLLPSGPAGNTRSRYRSNSLASGQESLPGSYVDTDHEETPTASRKKGKDTAPERTLDFTKHLGYFDGQHPKPAVFSNSRDFMKELSNPQTCKDWYEALIDLLTFHDSAFTEHHRVQKERGNLEAELKRKCDELTKDKDKLVKKYNDKKTDWDSQKRAYVQVVNELTFTKKALAETQNERDSALQELEQFRSDSFEEHKSSQNHLHEHDNQSESEGSIIPLKKQKPSEETNVIPTGTINFWRPRGTDPSKSLSGKRKDDYAAWAYTVKRKVDTDSPIYPNDTTKIDYALSKMTDPIFDVMLTWVEGQSNPTWVKFFEEVEHYLGLHMQATEARHQLHSIKMKNDESVDEYYHRINKLWQKANIPEVDRIRQFIITLRPLYSASLVSITFTNMRDLLDNARTIEDRKKEIGYTHFDNNQSGNRNKGNKATGQTNQKNSGNNNQPKNNINNSTPSKPKEGNTYPNARFMPIAVKPEGWIGKWFEPEQYPKKLDDKLRAELTKEGRCFGCRGSGHRAWETANGKPVCPLAVKKLNAQTIEDSSSDSESEKEKA